MTNAEYIAHLEAKLASLKPRGERLLQEEREAYINKNYITLENVRKESDFIFKQIRQTEEALGIAQTLDRIYNG